ncbi:MAG: hypothetical protein FJ146_07050 [Deltaproteobacteria bacterium]|nr:hypothetical protein [Deltaproteobacteria bacterium]
MSKIKMGVISTVIGAMLITSGCTYTRAISQTNVPSERGKVVEASVERMMFLGIAFDNDDVPKLVEKLRDKCPNGAIRGILTKDLSTSYLIVIVRKTIAQGYCIKENLAADDADTNLKAAELETEAKI